MPIHSCPPPGYSIKCEYSAHKEGVLKEEMLLACEGDIGTCVRVMVQARVMGELELGQVWFGRGRHETGYKRFLKLAGLSLNSPWERSLWNKPCVVLAHSQHVLTCAYLADRHHGTPMLLDGVKCVGAELEYDSEQSDWHGFD